MKIFGTGLSGLLGTRIVELLQATHAFSDNSRANGVDITDSEQIRKAINSSDAEVVLHLAAYTNVKAAELERDLGEQSESWKINVIGTENVARACKEAGKKLIFTSSDMVFDGENTPEGGYTEEAKPHPLSWYAKTKYEGELRVQALTTPWIIIRPAYPYRARFEKNDFVRLFMQKLSQGEQLTVLTDRIITPVFIDDLAPALDALLMQNAEGIYHTVGSTQLSIFEAAEQIAECFNYDKKLIGQTTRAEFLVGRPPEPFNSALNNAKIKRLGVEMRTFREGLEEIKKQQATVN